MVGSAKSSTNASPMRLRRAHQGPHRGGALFARRRDLFTDLDLVFFDTTSVFFTGEGGESLGQYGKSKDRRSDCKQMVLGMVIDGDGVPVCSEMWPGNTTDVTTLDRVAERLQRRSECAGSVWSPTPE